MTTFSSATTKLADILPSTTREGNHVTIVVGNAPLAANFVPSHESKDSGRPIVQANEGD
jgi:hypothetical protein